jgi:hypothetical protein
VYRQVIHWKARQLETSFTTALDAGSRDNRIPIQPWLLRDSLLALLVTICNCKEVDYFWNSLFCPYEYSASFSWEKNISHFVGLLKKFIRPRRCQRQTTNLPEFLYLLILDFSCMLIDWLTCRWVRIPSHNRGHQLAYYSSSGWYESVECHYVEDDDLGELLTRKPELPGNLTSRDIWGK